MVIYTGLSYAIPSSGHGLIPVFLARTGIIPVTEAVKTAVIPCVIHQTAKSLGRESQELARHAKIPGNTWQVPQK